LENGGREGSFRKFPEKCGRYRNSREGGKIRRITAREVDKKILGRFGRFSQDFAIITSEFNVVKEQRSAINGNIYHSCEKSTRNIQVMMTNHKKRAGL
jgi:hypothetical protein